MPNKQTNIVAEFEQLEQMVIQAAQVVQSYYAQLVKSGLDPEFARDLTRDFASEWWDNMFSSITRK